MPKYFVL